MYLEHNTRIQDVQANNLYLINNTTSYQYQPAKCDLYIYMFGELMSESFSFIKFDGNSYIYTYNVTQKLDMQRFFSIICAIKQSTIITK